MDRLSFSKLCKDLGPYICAKTTRLREAIPVNKRVAIGLYRLTSSAEMRSISHIFGVGISTVHIVHAVVTRYKGLIKFPTTRESLLKTAQEFEDLCQYPLCIGSLDGCHIPCSPPKEQATDYYNYKGWYSSVLLAVCNARYLFSFVHIGTPGRSNDGFIFRHSYLHEELKSKTRYYRRLGKKVGHTIVPLHLIADSAFPLEPFLMKPYPEHSKMPDTERQFNFRLSSARRVIENAFGRLKGRFQILAKRYGLVVILKVLIL